MITYSDKLRIETLEEKENKIRAEHIEDHRTEPDYLCKYCVRGKLESLDMELPPPNDGETIKKP